MLANSGRIEGRDRLDIKTADALVNRGGALVSQGDVEIDGGALFANISGTVSGNGVRITAGDIEHATAVVRDRYGKNFADRAQQTARIEARGDLALEATGSISATGSDIAAGGNAVLRAGGDIGIRALAVEKRFKDIFREGYNLAAALTHRQATLKAGGDVTVDAGKDLTLRGATVEAGADAQLAAGGNVTVASVQDRRQKDFKYDFRGSGPLGVETNIREQRAMVETKRSTVAAGGTLTVRAGTGDLTLDAARLKSGGETVLDAAEGKVALLTETDSSFKQDYKRTEDLVWWKERDKGHYKEEIEHVEIEAGGGLKIVAGDGIVVEYHKTDSLNASLDRLAQSPGLAWIDQLRDNPDVDWTAVDAAFKEWDYKAEGLTQAGAALVSLVTAAVTAGTLSSVSAMLAKGLGFAGAGSMQAALQAGLTSLTSQASVALVNNRGDLGAALRQLGSSLTLKSLATAMIAAGLSTELTQLAGLDKALPKNAVFADRVVHSLQRNLIRSTVQAAVATAIQGGKLDDALMGALRTAAAQTIGEHGAQQISKAYLKAAADGVDPIEFALHKVAHAALGCVTAGVGGSDCASSAAGGAAGETFAEAVGRSIVADLAARVESGELSRKEALARLSDPALKRDLVKGARLAGAIAAIAAGAESEEDINAAAEAGANAVENNFCGLGHCVIIGIGLGALYAAIVGKGDPLEGLKHIGNGDDPLSKAMAAGTRKAVELSYDNFPEATADAMAVVVRLNNAVNATVTWIDKKTEKTVSGQWNELDDDTRSQIKGGVKIVSIALPVNAVRFLAGLRKAKPGTIQRGFHSSGYRSEFYNAAGNPAKWRNPETGKLENIPAGAVFHKDHVSPLAGIRELKGFNELSPYQKASLLTDPKNYQPLLGSMNCSKGCRVVDTANDWKTYKGQPLNEGYREWLKGEQNNMIKHFNKRIEHFLGD